MSAPATVPLHRLLADARRRLIDAGLASDEAAVDVDVFVRTLLGWNEAQLITERSEPVPDALEPRFSEFLARRARREPCAYIVGVREFWGLDFRVTRDVLIPRPETEFVVEEALRLLGDAPATNDRASGSLRIADIGTGSGCIAVALAREIPGCRVVATDVSPEAVGIARENAIRHGVGDRVAAVAASYLDGVDGTFDLIAANPPYVRDGDKPALAADVRHEPEVALFGGSSGLRNIAGVLDVAVERLSPAGWLIMEFGFGQEDDVRALVGARPALRVTRVREDLQGIARTAIVQRQA